MLEAQKEMAKNTFLAYIAVHTPTFNEAHKAKEWSNKVSKTWTTYSSLEMGLEVVEEKDTSIGMSEAYEKFVKDLKPVLNRGENGEIRVSGLDNLIAAHGVNPETLVAFDSKKEKPG
jgi:hypothetical protein